MAKVNPHSKDTDSQLTKLYSAYTRSVQPWETGLHKRPIKQTARPVAPATITRFRGLRPRH